MFCRHERVVTYGVSSANYPPPGTKRCLDCGAEWMPPSTPPQIAVVSEVISRSRLLIAATAIAENHTPELWTDLPEGFRKTCLVDARAALVAVGLSVEE